MADGSDRSETARADPRRGLTATLIVVGALLAVAVIGSATAVYTEGSSFCPTCHEMQPYYDAWLAGRHPTTPCIDCHIDPGLVSHGVHKFIALREVWDHFTTAPRYPRYDVVIPNRRCVGCHPTVPGPALAKFSHAFHEKQGPCYTCHLTTGHDVSRSALQAAGILDPNAPLTPPGPAGRVGVPVAGHVPVPCARCHDMPKMPCSACHVPKHEPRGECSNCHRVGTSWSDVTFNHPPSGEHSYRDFPCVKCHPSGYTSASCTCHGGRAPSDD